MTTASSVLDVFVGVDGGGRTPGRVVLALKLLRISRRFHSDIVRSEDRGKTWWTRDVWCSDCLATANLVSERTVLNAKSVESVFELVVKMGLAFVNVVTGLV